MTEASEPTQTELMVYRPVSQMLKLFVLPEIDRRVRSGVIRKASLPLQVHQFRVVQPGPGHVVELNEETRLTIKVKATKALKAGQLLALGDIDPDSSVLEPPVVDGTPRSYFLFQSAFLNLLTMFDFTRSGHEGIEPAPPMQFPIAEFVRMQEFLKAVNPVEKFTQLAALNWPPAPGYFPNVIGYAHANPDKLKDAEFADAVSAAYDERLLRRRIDLWTEAELFPGRLDYVQKAVEEYFAGDWISSIYVVVPQFESILRDYLRAAGAAPKKRFGAMVRQLEKLVFSRKVLLFPSPVLNLILDFLSSGTFWKTAADIGDPTQEVNRHGIVHGVFTSFQAKNIALKYLVLVDALALVMLHDQVVSGTL